MDKHEKGFDNIGIREIYLEDLPLACPTSQMALWNAHPRVYLPIEEQGEARCPYCGAFYRLKDRDT